MNDILKGIPDKRQDKNTTSLKFKQDMIEFLGDDYKDKICLEIGAHRGYTTRILSFLFKEVISCENNDEGYPEHNGLVVQMEVLRRHNEQDVVDSMEDQWVELKYNSRREQLSFNYIAWKNDLKFSYIQGDSRDNKYFLNIGAHTGKK